MSFVLEIAVESVAAAQAAERAGADRIELCANLSVGGVTPSERMMQEARACLHIPIFAMIRPRAGNFVYDRDEFTAMRSQIATARSLKMDGIVVGILSAENAVDIGRTHALVESASPLPVTFHRAFDQTPDLAKALEDAIASGATRLLTSGGAANAPNGRDKLRDLVRSAGSRIIVMPGAGIQAENFADLRRATEAKEFHAGLGTVLPYGHSDFARFEREIRKIVTQKSK